jgi:hypothetical protein
MKLILTYLVVFVINISRVYSISYSVQDLGLQWSERSIPSRINENGTVVGKLIEREPDDFYTHSYTDFMWTPENGLMLINSKQASKDHYPSLNNNDEIVGVYWNKVAGWFQKYQEENLYKYNIKEGFTEIPVPKNWKRAWSEIFYTPWSSDSSTSFAGKIVDLKLIGYTDQDELLVEVEKHYEIRQKGVFKDFKVDKHDALWSMNCEGRIAINRTVTSEKNDTGRKIFMDGDENSERLFGLFRSLDTKELKILDYFSEHPEEATFSEASSGVIQILAEDKAIGLMIASLDKTSEGYFWSAEKGYIRFKNFLPIAGNKYGQLIGKQLVKTEGQDRLRFMLWIEGNFYDMEDLMIDMSQKGIKEILNVVDINTKGQILIQAQGLSGPHSFLLNPQK